MMEEVCRLCCSTKYVNNNIFDEESALYLKMSLYLPIKIIKNDRLPQKICDRCSCKVNDFYQFCNETIEVQNRLRSILHNVGLEEDESADVTRIKVNASPSPIRRCEQSTQTDHNVTTNNDIVNIKQEHCTSPALVKQEDAILDSDNAVDHCSDNSEDISLITLKKRKKKKQVNGIEKKSKKKKNKLKDWEILMNALPEGAALSLVDKSNIPKVLQELPDDIMTKSAVTVNVEKLKKEPNGAEIFNCCICLTQCYSRSEMLQHYRQHAEQSPMSEQPIPPLPPGPGAQRCTRCRKEVPAEQWETHWQKHWARDRRPYRCALCEKAYRDHHQILKHGLTHKYDDGGEGAGGEGAEGRQAKRFVCDFCPERFVYMRYLLAHRTRAHPESAARPLVLRCGTCSRDFAHLNSLRRHLRAHSGERNHLCNVCGKALSSREHLKFHIRIHTGYKPNVCKTCGKGFVKKCNLTLHERVHSGEKPHVCSHCGKAFSQRSTLVIHERYHSGSRPYVCALCGRGFVAKGLLSMHLKSTCI